METNEEIPYAVFVSSKVRTFFLRTIAFTWRRPVPPTPAVTSSCVVVESAAHRGFEGYGRVGLGNQERTMTAAFTPSSLRHRAWRKHVCSAMSRISRANASSSPDSRYTCVSTASAVGLAPGPPSEKRVS